MTSDAVHKKVVKVLVWDLDETLWSGTLLEGDDVQLRPGVLDTLRALDARGILHSIASRSDAGAALARLRALGVDEYFLYPQIHWNAKSQSVRAIAEAINVGLDALAFVDDQPFERDEVAGVHPDVLTFDASDVATLAQRPEFMPRFITDESARRRHMYRADAERNQAEQSFVGPSEEFLAGLRMRFTIAPALEEDLRRAEELTVRTNQLNSTGYTYSYDELDRFRRSPDHLLLVAGLEDRYGPYGKIGLVLIEKGAAVWTLKLLLMSCRVVSRGVGTVLMNHVLGLARAAGVRLQAEFRNTGRNRMMLVSYKFAGFKEVDKRGELAIFEHDLERLPPPPPWMEMTVVPLA
jgi:FkbH-like protein